jgi:hypothetical protein
MYNFLYKSHDLILVIVMSRISVCKVSILTIKKGNAVPLHAMEALGGRGGIAPTHSRPRH